MQTQCSPDLFGFAPVEGRRVEAAFDAGLATSDAGALLLGATDKAIGLIGRFAACFEDVRRQDLIEHAVSMLVGHRAIAIALGYEDLNDHDHLRHDPVMAVLAGKLRARRRNCAPVAELCPMEWCPKVSRGLRRRERSDRSLRLRGRDGREVAIACLR